jgi:hypothetical protein
VIDVDIPARMHKVKTDTLAFIEWIGVRLMRLRGALWRTPGERTSYNQHNYNQHNYNQRPLFTKRGEEEDDAISHDREVTESAKRNLMA